LLALVLNEKNPPSNSQSRSVILLLLVRNVNVDFLSLSWWSALLFAALDSTAPTKDERDSAGTIHPDLAAQQCATPARKAQNQTDENSPSQSTFSNIEQENGTASSVRPSNEEENGGPPTFRD
jgi:hypothetical protein